MLFTWLFSQQGGVSSASHQMNACSPGSSANRVALAPNEHICLTHSVHMALQPAVVLALLATGHIAYDLLLELRTLNPRVTIAALQEAMVPLRVTASQKQNAAKSITEAWQAINKKLRNSPVGSRLTPLEKAFRDLEGQPPRELPAPLPAGPADPPHTTPSGGCSV
eukprot:3190684-Amphidinium_carterae.1